MHSVKEKCIPSIESYWSIIDKNRGRWLWALLYVIVVVSYHYLAVWSKLFSQPGPAYLVNSFLKLAFIVFFLQFLATLGAFFLPDRLAERLGSAWTPLDILAMRGLFGAGAAVTVVFSMGFAGLYHFWFMVVLTVPLAYLGAPTTAKHFPWFGRKFKDIQWRSFETWVVTAILAVLCLGITDVYVRNVNLPTGYFDGDVPLSYFPFYRELVETSHAWWPSSFHQFFFSKGSGLQILAVVLLDPLAASLGSFVLLLFSFPALYGMGLRLSRRPSLAAMALLLYGMSRMTHNLTFYKPHVGMSAWIILWMAFLSLYWRTSGRDRSRLLPGGVAALLGLAVFQPMIAGLAAALLIWLWAGARFRRDGLGTRPFLVLLATGCLGMTLMLTINRVYTGIWDISFISGLSYVDLPRFGQWVSPVYLKMLTLIQSGPNGVDGTFKDSFISLAQLEAVLGMLFVDAVTFWGWMFAEKIRWLPLVGLFGAVALLAGRSLRRGLPECRELWLLLGAEGMSFSVFLIIQHEAMIRVFFFTSGLCALVVAALAGAIVLAVPESKQRNAASVLAVVLLLLAPNIHRDIAFWDWGHYLKPVTGEWSFERFQEYNYPTAKYVDIQERLPADSRCLVLNPKNGSLTIPFSPYEMFLYNHFMKDLCTILHGPPEKSKDTLVRNGVGFVIVSVDDELDGIVLSSCLLPENIGAYWSVTWTDGKWWVLAWREKGQQPLPEAFINAYRIKVEQLPRRTRNMFESQ